MTITVCKARTSRLEELGLNNPARPVRILVSFVFLCNVVLQGFGQTQGKQEDPWVLTRLTEEMIFDGIPGERFWNEVPGFEMVMYSPKFGAEPTEKTLARIVYDDQYLYVAGNCYYEDPSQVRSASYKRDYSGAGSDWFGIILDSFNDKENGLGFFTSPDALRWDGVVFNDANASEDLIPVNISWNTFWDVKTVVTEEGWFTEIRIPMSSLRFQEREERIVMGLILFRWLPAKNEMYIFPAIPPNWGQWSTWKVSQAREVEMSGVKSNKPLYIAPYILAGFGRTNELNDAGTDYLRQDKPALEAGLDLKYGLSNNLTLDLTANTDFAQVEADNLQINLTRFSLYFPEKRAFFLERSSIFDFNLGGPNRLFYSRRIGLSEDGDPVRLYGGGRLIGRLGKWDVGFMNMQAAALWKENEEGLREEILPSQNFGVLRLRRQVINENTYVGGMLTTRVGTNGEYNIACGLDGLFRLFGNDYLEVIMAQSYENDSPNKTLSSKPTRLNLSWERRNTRGIGYEFSLTHSGEQFNPGIGFEARDDYRRFETGVSYGWLPENDPVLYNHSLSNRYSLVTSVIDNSLESAQVAVDWSWGTKKSSGGSIALQYNVENVRDTFTIGNEQAEIPSGRYDFFDLEGAVVSPATNPLVLMALVNTGMFYDGWRFSFHLEPTWNINIHFEVGGIYRIDRVSFAGREQSFTNHIAGLRALYMLNTKFSLSTFVQYNTAIRAVISNFRLRYNPREGNDLYLVIDEGRNTTLDREVPRLPRFSARTILLKYTYTFSL